MKKPIIIANWKMNLSFQKTLDLTSQVKDDLSEIKDKDIIVCPSAVALSSVAGLIKNTNLKLGAQNVFWEENGAYTGETSPAVLQEIGCQYTIVGHSERRKYLGETNLMVNKKVNICLENNLTPILCIGETKDERHEGLTDNVLYHQLKECLDGVNIVDNEDIVIAYEPVWAIGSGDIAEPEEVARVFELIQQVLIDIYPLTVVKNNVRMVYGGSVDSDGAVGFSQLKLLDGFLVGGASLEINKFKEIVKSL
ncbi:MAG: triose-phosphate isomerase [Candidatus Buchananbacteria bacterium]|nr:triose-phosphate isomerase [Candidatus Buchananbacteria bacterium]